MAMGDCEVDTGSGDLGLCEYPHYCFGSVVICTNHQLTALNSRRGSLKNSSVNKSILRWHASETV